MRDRVCIVTGANRGIGYATARGLAQLGATVVIVGRDSEGCIRARDEIRSRTGNASVSYLTMDLGSLTSVRQGAAELARRFPAIHVLVNNAGVVLPRRTVSPDGFEMTLAVNHLGAFLLTHLMLPLLRAGAPARIVSVTSMFERLGRIAFDDLQGARRYGALRAYYQSKLANVLFTRALAQRLAGTGVTATCVDPGLVATDLLRASAWWNPRWLQMVWRRFLFSPETAAARVVQAVVSPELARVTGVCFGGRGRLVRTSKRSRDDAVADRLWEVSAGMVGLLEGRSKAINNGLDGSERIRTDRSE
jgi:NAD(P)-dependent dehydrogenase (short-subunit alcohol dehydrogenase family)